MTKATIHNPPPAAAADMITIARSAQKGRTLTLALAVSAWSLVAFAQDVHVRVSSESRGTTASASDFRTIQMALDHAPQPDPGGRLYVEIAPGIYHERVMVTQNHPRTTFQGTGKSPEDVVITASENAKSAGGTFFSSTAVISGDGFEADNVTFENAAGNTGQAVAVSVRSDKAIFKHCRFLGDQDTLFADYGRQYYVDSDMQGGVDFIFGNATAVFADDEVHIIRPGYLTAQSRTSPTQNTGYVFLHDRITAGDMGEKTFFLGRPWRPFSRVVFLSSQLPASLSPQGWSPWTKDGNIDDAFYAEQDDTGPGARPKDRLSGSRQLTAEEAAQFMPERFLAGSDHWDAVAEAVKLP
jgi:pectinesterase